MTSKKSFKVSFHFLFHFYIYPPDSQESNGGTIPRATITPTASGDTKILLSSCKSFYFFIFIELSLKFRTAC